MDGGYSGNGFLAKDIEYIKNKIDGLSSDVTNVKIDIATIKTRLDMLNERIDAFPIALETHAKECPVKKDFDVFKQQYVKFSFKLLASYVALAAAAVGVYSAVSKLF
jgi:uncharacterized coiled-coil DUF342 family protein